jgi:hypothetical protein
VLTYSATENQVKPWHLYTHQLEKCTLSEST